MFVQAIIPGVTPLLRMTPSRSVNPLDGYYVVILFLIIFRCGQKMLMC